MLGHVESMSRTTLLVLFGLALLVPVTLTSVQIYQKRVAPKPITCDDLTRTLEEIDVRSTVPRSPILILGDTPLQHWKHPLLSVGTHEVVVRSPKGLTSNVVGQCFQRAVAFYHPLITTLFIGRDELNGDVLPGLITINERRNYYGVSPFLVLVPPIDVPIDGRKDPALERFRHQLEEWATAHPGTLIADLNRAFEDEQGRVNPKLFWPDGRTLTTEGFRRMSLELKALIQPLIPAKSSY